MSITFVTAFIDLLDDNNERISPENRIKEFEYIVNAGLKIILFVSDTFYHLIEKFKDKIKIVRCNFENLPLTNKMNTNLQLPDRRDTKKDTLKYFYLINSKPMFVAEVAKWNPLNTSYFAWIDFSIGYIHKDKQIFHKILQNFLTIKLPSKCLIIPGCIINKNECFIDSPNWRFCGGFFVGDKETVKTFHTLCESDIQSLLNEHKITWEVNIWARIEKYISIQWYYSDHNEQILQVPIFSEK